MSERPTPHEKTSAMDRQIEIMVREGDAWGVWRVVQDLESQIVSLARERDHYEARLAELEKNGTALDAYKRKVRDVLAGLRANNREQLERTVDREREIKGTLGFAAPVWAGRVNEDERIARELGLNLEANDEDA